MMSETTRDRIVAAAAKDQHWNAAKVKLVPKEELDRPGCSFFVAVPEDRAVSAPGYFGVLPDGRVVLVGATETLVTGVGAATNALIAVLKPNGTLDPSFGNGGVLQVDPGSLYPALHRLERQKWIAATWKLSANKQRTRVYRLTAAGRRQLASERSRWETLVHAMTGILARPQEG